MNRVSSWQSKVVGLFLLFVMTFGVCLAPASSLRADPVQDLDVEFYAACAFHNDLNMVYYCDILTPGEFTDLRLHVEFQKYSDSSDACTWETREITNYTVDEETGRYRFVFSGIAAAEMTNTAKFTLWAKSGSQEYKSEEKEFSIRRYAKAILASLAGSTDEKDKLLCSLMVDMLNYGTAAQLYFGRNTGDLANSTLTDQEKAFATGPVGELTSCLDVAAQDGSTVSFDSVSLNFINTVDLLAYVTFDSAPQSTVKAELSYKDVDGKTRTMTVSKDKFELWGKDNECCAIFKDLSVLYFRSPLTIVFKDGDRTISPKLTYSYESYAQTIVAGNYEETLKDLVKSMLLYGDSAYKYFSYTGSVEPEGDYVTYSMFKDPSDPDDYMSFVRAHEYANEHGLPVKADPGAVYYISHMDTSNPRGALIMTDTDWGDAQFVIDDSNITLEEGECFLFTVAPSAWGVNYYMSPSADYFLGVDPRLSQYPEHSYAKSNNSFPEIARQLDLYNRTFSSDTEAFQLHDNEYFEDEQTLFVIRTETKRRWGRYGSSTASDPEGKKQQEIILVNRDGTIDETTKLQWDWDKIDWIEKYKVDQDLLTVKGGSFTTIVNHLNSKSYVYRGISVQRSNVLIEGVEHYLEGEEACFTDGTKYPRVGAPYQGFIRVDHCAYVTVKDCVLMNHLRTYNYGNNVNTTAPYDYYAEYAASIVLDHVTCAGDGDDPSGPADSTGIMDKSRWGTTGTNFCKTIIVRNQSSISRIDAHKGTYNLTVENSELGYQSVAAVGFGEMRLINVTAHSDHFITLRNDYGSAWYGNIYIENCTWDIGTDYTVDMINALYNPANRYGFEPFEEDGITYYCSLPTKIEIHGFTIDATHLVHTYDKDGNPYDGPAIVFYNQRGLNIFTSIFTNVPSDHDLPADYLEDTEEFPYPLRVTKEVYIEGLKVITNPEYAGWKLKNVSVRSATYPQIHDELVFADTVLTLDGEITYDSAEPDPKWAPRNE